MTNMTYGETYGVGNTIGVYVDLTDESGINKIYFSKNGNVFNNVAFEIGILKDRDLVPACCGKFS
jgi:hypothetical protein